MARNKERLIEAALDLAWSHWTGLGVRGAVTPPDSAVDPEALIYLTAYLAPYDPRLRDEVSDWWIRFQRHVSRPRLTRLASQFDPSVVDKFTALDAMWATKPMTSGKSRLDDLEHPSRALLRLRCAFGVNARAEILLALLTQWSDAREGVTALALSEVGYGKRNIAMILEDLRMAGMVVATPDANRMRYRVADAVALRTLLHPLPLTAGRWHLRMPIIAGFVELADRLRGKDPMVQAIEARKYLARHARRLAILGINEPIVDRAEAYWDRVQQWLVDKIIFHAGRESRNLPRMIAGVWIGPNQDVRIPDHPSAAVLPLISADPLRDLELTCLDLVQVPTVNPPNDWAWAVLSDAATNVYQHTIGLDRDERWRFVTSENGTLRTYVAAYAPRLAHDQIARLYGAIVAERARRDRRAVQLHLKLIESRGTAP